MVAASPVQAVASGRANQSPGLTSGPAIAAPDPGPAPIQKMPRIDGGQSNPRLSPLGPLAPITRGTWSWQNPVPDGNSLHAISCPSISTCFAGSSDGRIRATTNGGSTWGIQATGIATQLNGISCAATTTCVAVGDFGQAIRTTNGGANWSSVIVNSGNFLAGVSCPTTSICFADGALG